MSEHNHFVKIWLTLIFAMCLRIMPWSEPVILFNPDWLLLCLIYWAMAIPERIGIFYAWAFGLLTDVLMGNLFGQHAFVYSIVIYCSLLWHKRLRQFPLVQQSGFVFICLLFSELILFWLKTFQSPDTLHSTFWLPIFSGALLWSFIYSLLRYIRLM